jgi:hypothetical protein
VAACQGGRLVVHFTNRKNAPFLYFHTIRDATAHELTALAALLDALLFDPLALALQLLGLLLHLLALLPLLPGPVLLRQARPTLLHAGLVG